AKLFRMYEYSEVVSRMSYAKPGSVGACGTGAKPWTPAGAYGRHCSAKLAGSANALLARLAQSSTGCFWLVTGSSACARARPGSALMHAKMIALERSFLAYLIDIVYLPQSWQWTSDRGSPMSASLTRAFVWRGSESSTRTCRRPLKELNGRCATHSIAYRPRL